MTIADEMRAHYKKRTQINSNDDTKFVDMYLATCEEALENHIKDYLSLSEPSKQFSRTIARFVHPEDFYTL